eukprot:CAMPEP_0113320052 /NCGR_PEP_ID=MMETSP0010_2-20120614/14005_1 /TAXON_ID=216773 ORGANISM="Corethron hystrix, Strain 308" /NCGR_SAMPLE_ID=MMETSP0010_2 /ASSEMBLY_ACC=CAM_ASM_000155 /LENGTH=209 /DNA_ID=CAMNT_0000177737 /DNA_START=138 /DNA_END=764 /DNA_ORIENTATION=+ /assembly_acc=CAM_ASM_000155
MRHGRAKAARRTLQFFNLATSGAISPPYKILLDGTFLVGAIKNKVELFERVKKILQNSSFSFFVTRAVLDELNTLDKVSKDATFGEARQYGLDECEIIEYVRLSKPEDNVENALCKSDTENEKISASESVCRLIGACNSDGYFVASQDDDLLIHLRATPNVPIFRLYRGVLCLDNPSSASRNAESKRERKKLLDLNDEEKCILKAVREC